MDVATIAKTAVQLAGSLCGIPGVPILADTIVILIETCDNIPRQRQTIKDLQRRCIALLDVLKVEESDGPPTSQRLEEAITAATEVISGVEKRMKRWAKKGRWKRFLRAGSIDDDIASSTAEVDRTVEKLQFLFHAQVRKDTREMVEHMQTFIVAANRQNSLFPQNVEEGYNVMKEMQQAYRSIDPSDKEEKQRSNILRENILELQKEFGIVLPDAILVENEVQITSDSPVGGFGLYDLYPGTYLGKEVWCKKLSYGDPNGKATMRFKREIDIWRKLWKKDQEQRRSEGTLPRVLPFYGFYMPYEGAAYLVNAKPERGTLRDVLRSGAQLDPLKIIKGIAQVLLLVHTMEPPIFHGDLNCTSIVVDKDWNPLLQDFRLSKTAFDVSGPTAVTHTIEKHTPGGIEPVRWMAPETFNPRVGNTGSDIWSFGMVMYEILTSKDPYHEYSMFTVIAKVASGGTPNRPVTITNDNIWNLMKDCWTLKSSERPSIQDVIRRLEVL